MSRTRPMSQKTNFVPWYLRIGPGLIAACVVIGPGSISTSSQVGAQYGYSMNWIVVIAVLCMMVYTTLGAKLGMVARQTPGDLVAERAGRPWAALLGLSVFMIAALFQFGNNVGVQTAISEFASGVDLRETDDGFQLLDLAIVGLNLVALVFLFAFKNIYRAIEVLMMCFVAVMLVSFAANLVLAKPNVVELASGFIPSLNADIEISLLALVGTTFVTAAAFLQCYLVKQKGWSAEEVTMGIVDARVGAGIMAIITLMIVATSAATLRGEQLNNARDIARGLEPLFGGWGRPIFCLGLFSAAFSSFLVNSMVGGFILSDGLGLGAERDGRWPRIFTAAVLLIGMVVALYTAQTETKPVVAIVTAQALTVLAAPLLAAVLWWLTSSPSVMERQRNGIVINIFAGFGFALLLAIAIYTAGWKVWPPVKSWLLRPHTGANTLKILTNEPPARLA